MAGKDQDQISLFTDDLEKRTGGRFLALEHLDHSLPSSPSTSWLLAKKHLLISGPVATFAFPVNPKVKTILYIRLECGSCRFNSLTYIIYFLPGGA